MLQHSGRSRVGTCVSGARESTGSIPGQPARFLLDHPYWTRLWPAESNVEVNDKNELVTTKECAMTLKTMCRTIHFQQSFNLGIFRELRLVQYLIGFFLSSIGARVYKCRAPVVGLVTRLSLLYSLSFSISLSLSLLAPPRFAQPAGPSSSLILLIRIHIHWRCGRHKHCYVQARDGSRNGDAMPAPLVGRDRPRAARVYAATGTLRKTSRACYHDDAAFLRSIPCLDQKTHVYTWEWGFPNTFHQLINSKSTCFNGSVSINETN